MRLIVAPNLLLLVHVRGAYNGTEEADGLERSETNLQTSCGCDQFSLLPAPKYLRQLSSYTINGEQGNQKIYVYR